MNISKFLYSCLLLIGVGIPTQAQIGYQVSLLNNATGEPRANENVVITVKITDSTGKAICEETKNETTNDFGVVSMSVGNSDTFTDANWNNLPFFIEATVDNRLIGRSQILSVPIAEYAKNSGALTKDILCSKTWNIGGEPVVFHRDNTATYHGRPCTSYYIDGNMVVMYLADSDWYCVLVYFPPKNKLVELQLD